MPANVQKNTPQRKTVTSSQRRGVQVTTRVRYTRSPRGSTGDPRAVPAGIPAGIVRACPECARGHRPAVRAPHGSTVVHHDRDLAAGAAHHRSRVVEPEVNPTPSVRVRLAHGVSNKTGRPSGGTTGRPAGTDREGRKHLATSPSRDRSTRSYTLARPSQQAVNSTARRADATAPQRPDPTASTGPRQDADAAAWRAARPGPSGSPS